MFIDGGESRVGILNVAPDYELDVSGDVGIDGRLVHNGDDNTNIEFTTDRIQFFAGSNTSSWIDIQSAGSELTINENDLQRDFRIEGGTDEELFFVDGSADRIGISTNAPDATLDIEGTLQYVDGNQAAGKVLTSDGSGNATWQDAFGGTSLADDDNDTKIQVEESADEDKIRFDTGGSERMVIDNNGKVGIGTTTPDQALEVNGNVLVGPSNTDSFIHGDRTLAVASNRNLTFIADADDISGPATGGGIIFGNGSSVDLLNNRDTDFSSAFGSSGFPRNFHMIIDGSGNVGIGSFPTTVLHVVKQTDASVWLEADTDNSGEMDNPSIYLTQDNGAVRSIIGMTGDDDVDPRGLGYSGGLNNSMMVGTVTANHLQFGTSANARMTILGTGNIGIGTNNPTTDLEVSGTIKITGGSPGADKVLTSDASGLASWVDPNTLVSSSTLSDDDDDTKIQVEESVDEDKIRFDTGNSERMIIDENGNIGVGTSSPVNLLHVQNNVSGLNFPVFLRNSSVTAGDGAGIGFLSEPNGNWTKAGIYYERTAGFGIGKLHLLVDDGADNQSVTLSESRLTIKADGNVGIGTTTPSENLHIKSNADVGIWLEADADNATETDNPYIKLTQDNQAVSSIIGMVGGNNLDSEQNAFSDTWSNSTLIGTTDGNHLQLGTNSNVRMTFLGNGNTGIGTNLPSATLDLVGTFQYVDGNQGAGKVLTSDADGDATWENPVTATYGESVLGFNYTINSSSYTNTGLQVTLPEAGTYRLYYAGATYNQIASNIYRYRLYNSTSATVVPNTLQYTRSASAGGVIPFSTETFITISGPTTIDFQVIRHSGSGDATLYDITKLTYVKLSN